MMDLYYLLDSLLWSLLGFILGWLTCHRRNVSRRKNRDDIA